VALLRGINVGGNNKVEMKKLKAVFESAKFKNVLTYINSGNVIFDSEIKDKNKLAEKIELLLKKSFGFKIAVVVRSLADIKKIIAKIPKNWKNDTDQKTDVLFLWDEFDNKASLKLISQKEGVDNLIYIPGAIVWNLNKKDYTKSRMNKFIGTVLYKNMTARNVNTVRKLFEIINN